MVPEKQQESSEEAPRKNPGPGASGQAAKARPAARKRRAPKRGDRRSRWQKVKGLKRPEGSS